jgi:hypothetical protein
MRQGDQQDRIYRNRVACSESEGQGSGGLRKGPVGGALRLFPSRPLNCNSVGKESWNCDLLFQDLACSGGRLCELLYDASVGT